MSVRIIICRVDAATAEFPVVRHQPRLDTVESPFKVMKDILHGGMVEVLELQDGVSVYCDEEALMNGSPFNRNIPDIARDVPDDVDVIKTDPALCDPGEEGVHHIHGTFIIGRHDYWRDKPIDLTPKDIAKYMSLMAVKEVPNDAESE